jgi:hypothetical protein
MKNPISFKNPIKGGFKATSERWKEIISVLSGPTLLLAMTGSMGGFIFGADTGQISGFLIMTVYFLFNYC